MAVAEIIFSDDVTTRNPDLVPCTSVMWRKLVRLGPHEYASALAIMKRDERDETVLDMARKLRAYADAVHGPTHARISAVESRLQKLEDKIEENHKKLREEIKEDLLQISAVQIRGSGIQGRRFPDGERRYTPRAELWFYLRDCGENMRNGYFKDPKGLRWAFGIAAVEREGVKQLNSLPGLSENPSAVGLLKVEEQRVPIATSTVHRRQYRTNRDAVIPIHKMIRELESQGVVSKTHSPFNSPIWPVRKSEGEWRLTVDYRALNEVTPPLSAAVPDMLELQYELESKAASPTISVQLALDIAEREKWPKLYLYTDSWMVANALWGWLERWKKANWQRRGKPIWAADEWKDIAARLEKLPVKVRHVDAHVPKSRANEEHQNNEQVDQAAKIEVSKIDLDWQHKGELFLARWAHDASALGGGSFKNWEQHLAKATWLVNTRGSTNRVGPAQSESLHRVDGDKVPVVHVRGLLGKTVWINSASNTDKPIRWGCFCSGTRLHMVDNAKRWENTMCTSGRSDCWVRPMCKYHCLLNAVTIVCV
uniref:Uncharacterized protein n=1 Tax=Geospiza parvula TaxID=87175 RepID=A0A8U8C7R6_GEOPR